MKTWRQMEKLVDLGLVRHIGTCNMTIPKLELLLRDARIKPAVNEMETASALPAAGTVRVRARPRHRSPSATVRSVRPGARSATARPDDTVDIEDPGDRRDRRTPRRSSGGGLREVGGAARRRRPFRSPSIRATTWPICRASSAEPLTAEEMQRHRGHRPELPPDQRAGLSLEGGPDLGRPLGPGWR